MTLCSEKQQQEQKLSIRGFFWRELNIRGNCIEGSIGRHVNSILFALKKLDVRGNCIERSVSVIVNVF